MRHGKYTGAIAVTALALALSALTLGADEAAAAPPIVCVRNLSGGDLDVVAGIQAQSPERPGFYLGKAAARGGACRYADIDGDMNVSFRRAVPAAQLEQYSMIPTTNGGWRSCPAVVSTDGWYIYTVRRGWAGLTCRPGGGTRCLEDPGEYE